MKVMQFFLTNIRLGISFVHLLLQL